MNAPAPSKIVPGAIPRMKIAVVGSGISGASAAWALDCCHDVTLYESEDRPGGHTATVDIDYDGKPVSVDTGFIVYNTLNYPNLTAMFDHLGVKTHESDMSFSLSLDQGKLEWCGDNLASVFAQKRNLFRPSFLLMLREIFRFNKLCVPTVRPAICTPARSAIISTGAASRPAFGTTTSCRWRPRSGRHRRTRCWNFPQPTSSISSTITG